MRHLALLVVSGLGACGDNLLSTGVPLSPGAELVIVAHQDDDLLFMQPDLLEAVQRGEGVTSVYVTAGANSAGSADDRYEGLMKAYGSAAGSQHWSCGWIELEGHTAQHCRLEAKRVSLVFLAYPDGGKQGEYVDSLLHLWEGTATNVQTVAHRTAYYDREGLIETVAQIVRETEPQTVRTLEVAATHGRDHSDHMLVGALAILALARANSHADTIAYRGYSTADEMPNKSQAIYDATYEMLGYYEACATINCGTCGESCTTIGEVHDIWLQRRYAIGFRRFARGKLRTGTQCVSAQLTLVPCETAPAWELDSGGELRLNPTACLAVGDRGDVTLTECLGGRTRRFFLDDEGHVWSGMPPQPEGTLDYAHLWCLAPTEAGVRVQMCGADRAPAWELVPRTTETARLDLLITASGREVRLGDLTGDGRGDLCAIEDGLVCAPGDGAGGFTAAVRIDDAAAPLAIDPRSLTLGDVDGDGRADACGRDLDGVVCALAATNFAAERFSPSFNEAVAAASTSPSLTAVDANADGVADICGIEQDGVVCAPRGLSLQPTVRSQWPSPTAVLWPADLDGDRQADWCTATETGPACAAFAHRELTTDGSSWAYSFAGTVEVAPATTATVGLADVDGDGRADLCSLQEDRIVCARSQGRAFGPRGTLAILPSAASALWLGDLDGDGRADACADTGATITCAIR